MKRTIRRYFRAATFGLGALWLLGTQAVPAQDPGPPRASRPRVQERDKLAMQVEMLRWSGKFDEAAAVAERALDLERRAEDKSPARLSDRLARLAQLQALRGDWDRVLELSREALAVREGFYGKDHWRTADTRLALAFAEKVSGTEKPDQARIEDALRKEQAAARLAERGKNVEAERLEREVLSSYKSLLGPETAEVARAWRLIGRIRSERRDFPGAKQANERALVIRRKIQRGHHPDIADLLSAQGLAQASLGEFRAAKASFQQALDIFREALPPDDLSIADTVTNLGIVQNELWEYQGARASFEEALAISRKALPPGHPNLASSLNNLGVAQRTVRDFAAAKASLSEALAIRRKARPPRPLDVAESLNGLGILQCEVREFAAARKSHEEALSIYRKALPASHPTIAASLTNLGAVQWALREHEAAMRSHEAALDIYRKALPATHPTIAASLTSLGTLQWELRDNAAAKASFEEALAIYRQALPPVHPLIALSLANLGNAQYWLREYGTSKASYEEALAIDRKSLQPDHPEIARILRNLGSVQSTLKEYGPARLSYEESLTVSRQARPPGHPDIARSLYSLARLTLASGTDVKESLPRAAEAVDISQDEQLRVAIAQAEPEQLEMASESWTYLQLLISATMSAGVDPGLAYDRVVRAKGSVASQQRWAREARDRSDPETARLLERLSQVTRQIAGLSIGERPSDRPAGSRDLSESIRTLSDDRRQIERQLTERVSIYRAIQSRARVGSRDFREVLPKDTALVDVVDHSHFTPRGVSQQLVAFVVRPEREVVIVPLGPSRVIADLIGRWRDSHGAGKAPPIGATDPAMELRKRLWDPLTAHLGGAKVVLISPDGPLNGLPWAALPGSQPGRFLVHEFAFAVVPVPQLLPELLRAKPGGPIDSASLVVGNIDFDAVLDPARKPDRENHFPPLAGTMVEAKAVHDLFRAAYANRPAELITGKGATKEAFMSRAANCSHLLVATHGFFLPERERKGTPALTPLRSLEDLLVRNEWVTSNPALRSGLVFAGANYEATGQGNAFLTAMEASDLDLRRVDLAVLSACETGLGKVEGGEGVLGLQRAFQLAGARAAVTSLWKVPDAATQALMTRFHRNLWERRMAKLEALREAQIWLVEEGWNHPELDIRGRLTRPEPKRKEGDRVSPFYWASFVLSGDWR